MCWTSLLHAWQSMGLSENPSTIAGLLFLVENYCNKSGLLCSLHKWFWNVFCNNLLPFSVCYLGQLWGRILFSFECGLCRGIGHWTDNACVWEYTLKVLYTWLLILMCNGYHSQKERTAHTQKLAVPCWFCHENHRVFEISKLAEPEVFFIWDVFIVFATEFEFLNTF
jgi:hypothetical protein